MRNFQWVPASALLILGCLCASAATRLSPTDFTGKWDIAAHFAEGSTAAVLTLSQSGGRFKGSSAGLDARPTFALSYEGTLEGRRLHLTLTTAPALGDPVGELTLEIENGSLLGSGRLYNVPVTITGARPDERPHTPKTHEFVPTHYYTNLSGANPPVLHLGPGDTVKTSTIDGRASPLGGHAGEYPDGALLYRRRDAR